MGTKHTATIPMNVGNDETSGYWEGAVTVQFTRQAAEPDVGILSDWVEDAVVVALDGKKKVDLDEGEAHIAAALEDVLAFGDHDEKLIEAAHDDLVEDEERRNERRW